MSMTREELERAVAERLCRALLQEDMEKHPDRWVDFDIKAEITSGVGVPWLAVAREALAMCERVLLNYDHVLSGKRPIPSPPLENHEWLTPALEKP